MRHLVGLYVYFFFLPLIDRNESKLDDNGKYALFLFVREKMIRVCTVERQTFNTGNTYKCALCESNYGIGRLKIYISGIPTNSNGRDLMNFHNGPGREVGASTLDGKTV